MIETVHSHLLFFFEKKFLYKYSPLFRLYSVYKDNMKLHKLGTFYDFLNDLQTKILENNEVQLKLPRGILAWIVMTNDLNDFNDVQTVIKFVYEPDMIIIEKLQQLNKNSFICYKEASVFGTIIKSRSIRYKEPYRSINKTWINVKSYNELNDLRSTWYDKNTSSSWITYRNLSDDVKSYALLNGLFSFPFPEDEIFNKIALGSVSAWQTDRSLQKNHNINVIDFLDGNGKEVNRFNANTTFIPVTRIYSTAVASVAFDQQLRPFKINPKHITAENYKYYSSKIRARISRLMLIDLHPERQNLKQEKSLFNDYKYF